MYPCLPGRHSVFERTTACTPVSQPSLKRLAVIRSARKRFEAKVISRFGFDVGRGIDSYLDELIANTCGEEYAQTFARSFERSLPKS